MKKYVLIFSSILLFRVSYSQSSLALATLNNAKTATVTAITNGIILNETTASGTTNQTKIRIYNTSTTTKTYNLKRTDEVLNPGALAYFCVGSSCYPATTTTLSAGDVLVLPAGTFENNFTIDIDEASTVGLSVIKYKLYNVNNLNDTLSFKTTYNGTSSINKYSNSFSNLTVSPNPIIDIANISFSSLTNSNIVLNVKDVLGKTLISKNIEINAGENAIKLDLNDLSAGFYFINFNYENNLVSKKIIVN